MDEVMTSRSGNPGKPEIPGGGPILALDAGGHACSAAIRLRGGVVAQESLPISHGQAAALMPMIERVMRQSGIAYRDLARIAVAVGPGGFTGLRVAIAAARGLGLAAGVPVIGISSFQAAASNRAEDSIGRRVFVLIDSRRDEPYLAELGTDLRPLGAARILSAAEAVALVSAAAPAVVFGDGTGALAGHLAGDVLIRPTAVDAAAVAALAAAADGRFDLPPLPVYLRPPDVSKPKAGG